jgi:hypothetical protein
MASDLKSLARAARSLSLEDRGDLVDELLVGIASDNPGWASAWATEVDARWQQHLRSEAEGYAAEDVFAEVAAHLEKRRQRAS